MNFSGKNKTEKKEPKEDRMADKSRVYDFGTDDEAEFGSSRRLVQTFKIKNLDSHDDSNKGDLTNMQCEDNKNVNPQGALVRFRGLFTCSILASIVTILVSIVVLLTSIDPILEKCVHL